MLSHSLPLPLPLPTKTACSWVIRLRKALRFLDLREGAERSSVEVDELFVLV